MPINSYIELNALFPPPKYAGNPVISAVAPYVNICPMEWMIDPLDSSKSLLYVGQFQGNYDAESRIALYTGNRNDPHSYAFNKVVISKNATYDLYGARFGCTVEHNGTIFMYYVGIGTSSYMYNIALATSTDGGRNFTRYGPVVVRADSSYYGYTDPEVIILNGLWYMYMTFRDTNGVPSYLTLATSSDGYNWTKTWTHIVDRGGAGSYDEKYIEGSSAKVFGDDIVLSYTACSAADVWSCNLAYGTDPLAPFAKSADNPRFSPSASGWDHGCVAVPLIVNHIADEWSYLYQGTTQLQPASDWHIGAADFILATAIASGEAATAAGGNAAPPAETGITMSWDPVMYYADGTQIDPEDIAGYTIYLGTETHVYGTEIPVGNITTAAITGLTPDTLYYLAVSCTTLAGVESALSEEITAHTGDVIAAAYGAGMSASGGTATTIADSTIPATGAGMTAAGGDATTQVVDGVDGTVGVSGTGVNAVGGDAQASGSAVVEDATGEAMISAGGDATTEIGPTGDAEAVATGAGVFASGGYARASGKSAGLQLWTDTGILLTIRNQAGNPLIVRVV